VVDDNVDAAQTLHDLLELWGHEVRVAYEGEAALEIAAGYLPEVLLLDIGLPGLDGYEVARRLRGEPGSRTRSSLRSPATGRQTTAAARTPRASMPTW
jgi:CheY-like chemotaxis protein